jgi:hypothetical protein
MTPLERLREIDPLPSSQDPSINEIQPAIFQRTAVGFNLAKQERIKRAPVSRVNLENHLILIVSFFDRDHFCRKRGLFRRHFTLPDWSEQGLLHPSLVSQPALPAWRGTRAQHRRSFLSRR